MAYRKQQMSPVERFNGTRRRFLERIFQVKGKPINWTQLYIPEAVRVYNEELEHSSTVYTPKEALTCEEAQRIVRKAQIQRSPPPDVHVGDTVRIVSRDIQNVFDKKIQANWTQDLFTIKAVRGSRITFSPLPEVNNGNGQRGAKSTGSSQTSNQQCLAREVMSHEVMKIDPELLFEGPPKPTTEPSKKKPKFSSQRELRQIRDYLSAPNPPEALPERRQRRQTQRGTGRKDQNVSGIP
jgi:hypothetical protein